MTDRVSHQPRGQIKPLTGLRAVAAIWVVLEHFQQPLYTLLPASLHFERWIDAGYLGVEVFFILSGFIIAYTYTNALAPFGWQAYRRYVTARFARIYPVHAVTLAAVLTLVLAAAGFNRALNSSETYTWGSFLGNVVLLQGFSLIGAWNGPAWSITCEFAAYLLFPLLAVTLVKIKRAHIAFATALVIAGLGTASMISYQAATDSSLFTGAIPWMRIGIEFTTGALLYTGWSNLRRTSGKRWDALAIGAFGLGVVLLGLTPGVPWTLLLIPVIGLFVLGCAGSTGPLAAVFQFGPAQWLGRISYSLYMVHFIVLNVCSKLVPWQHYSDANALVRTSVAVLYFAAAIVAAAGIYYFIEEPGRKAIRKKFRPRSQLVQQ
jgi:peptidoglycan/LPS O-acetylase OafA/YrhL